jgi:hypothetical protein
MPRLGFEPPIPVFERTKTFHALDCAAVVIGIIKLHDVAYMRYCGMVVNSELERSVTHFKIGCIVANLKVAKKNCIKNPVNPSGNTTEIPINEF